MQDCIFCRIVARQSPAEVLFENDDAIGILDINPIHHGHALIIPKRHCTEFLELPPESFEGILRATHVVSRALKDSLALQGYNIFSNNGRVAGQSVFHFHFHITPRYEDDDIRFILELKKYGDGEMAAVADRIRQHIHL